MRSAMNYIEQTLALAEIIRLLPSSIAPYVPPFSIKQIPNLNDQSGRTSISKDFDVPEGDI
jgi:hypothetical protein